MHSDVHLALFFRFFVDKYLKMRTFRYAFLLSYPPVLKHVLKFYLGKEKVLNQYFDSKADEHGSAEKFGL